MNMRDPMTRQQWRELALAEAVMLAVVTMLAVINGAHWLWQQYISAM